MENGNYQKQETYATQKVKLKKALANEFYYEAVFIEYAIVEDRLESLLKHAGVKYQTKDGRSISIEKKLNIITLNSAFTNKYIKIRMTTEFIENIRAWKDKRNKITHAMMKQKYDPEMLKELALEGKCIVDVLDSKVKSINYHCFK